MVCPLHCLYKPQYNCYRSKNVNTMNLCELYNLIKISNISGHKIIRRKSRAMHFYYKQIYQAQNDYCLQATHYLGPITYVDLLQNFLSYLNKFLILYVLLKY